VNRVYAFLSRIVRFRSAAGTGEPFHDDRLRANQSNEGGPPFSFWRALVS